MNLRKPGERSRSWRANTTRSARNSSLSYTGTPAENVPQGSSMVPYMARKVSAVGSYHVAARGYDNPLGSGPVLTTVPDKKREAGTIVDLAFAFRRFCRNQPATPRTRFNHSRLHRCRVGGRPAMCRYRDDCPGLHIDRILRFVSQLAASVFSAS